MLNACCVSTESDTGRCMYGEVGDERRFLQIFLKSLKDCFYQRWWTNISNSKRFDLYHRFKSTLQCERYLGCMQSRIYKTALARFRLGVSDKLSLTALFCCFRPTKLPFLYCIDRRWVPYKLFFWNNSTNWLTEGAICTNPLFSQRQHTLKLIKIHIFCHQEQRKLYHRMRWQRVYVDTY